jgi:hypothetical protein
MKMKKLYLNYLNKNKILKDHGKRLLMDKWRKQKK